MAEFMILPPLVIGVILGIVELSFVHADERGMSWLTHGLHAIPVMFIFIFISMNITWALSLANLHNTLWISIGVRALIGIIAMVKIGSAAAIAGRVGEKKFHVLIIGLLVIAAPYIWDYLLKGLVGKYLPF
ncbi:hypothetical protein C4573_02750 [Candidatus Woesearchaeota archaeon]|nr:MAG: hypothetical protein C4573_02750 [Candidatus Woesearchaeota archaeon]